ncbi:MAG TPA: NDP-sugar synthase [Firmicutes bacterium]|nr:NDP-sugar synthase [Candidatus Fermentithermobacillaceae bacterium]
MQAVVLVGGFGTRLRPLTETMPKAVVPIANVPYIVRCLSYLEENGVDHVVLSMGYLPEPIEKVLADRPPSIKVEFCVEDRPLDTAGAIRYASGKFGELEDRFFVLNGDILTDIPLGEILSFHISRNAAVTIAAVPVAEPTRFGVLDVEPDGRIRRFVEKPRVPPSNLINAGIYVYDRRVLDLIPDGVPWSVERQLYPQMLERGEKLYARAFEHAYWTDIGSLEGYLKANFDSVAHLNAASRFGAGYTARWRDRVPAKPMSPGLWIHESALVSEHANLHPPVLIGPKTRVERGAVVGPSAVIGAGVLVEEGAHVSESVVLDDVLIGCQARVKKCVLSSGARVMERATVAEGSIIGPMTVPAA